MPSPIQQSEKIVFGTGRIWVTPAGSTQRLSYADLNDVSVDIKIDQKEIFAEGGFPIAVADGHRTIDIAAKHYTLALAALANDLGMQPPAAGSYGYIIDEIVTVVTHAYTLAKTGAVGSTLDVSMVVNGSYVPYQQVASGSEVAGQSYSFNGTAINFATGETATTGKVSYEFADTNGQAISIVNLFQNSTPSYSMDLVKRDISPIDGSTGFLIAHFNAVRPGSIKLPLKEGEYANFERTFKAFADPLGNVGTITFVNE
jgi:hypothetical protein